MFNLFHFFSALFASTVQQAVEEEQRVHRGRVDENLTEYDCAKKEEQQFFHRLDEEYEQKKVQESRKWYNNEREQLEWEMRNAELYGYNKEDIQSRMDYLNEQEQGESWY